jgi:hypothetical protein
MGRVFVVSNCEGGISDWCCIAMVDLVCLFIERMMVANASCVCVSLVLVHIWEVIKPQ